MKPSEFKNMTVLVVDDMFNMRRTIKNMLRHIGFENVIEAENGQRALDVINNRKIDLVISDWNMPQMPGVDLLRQVRDNPATRDTPFVMVTAEVSESRIVQAAETEVDGYLIKPFVAKALEEKIINIFKNRENPPPFDKFMKSGQKWLESGSMDQSISDFTEALKLRPDSARARQALGDAFMKKGDLKEAERWLQEAVRINPQYIRAYESLGEVCQKEGKDDQALRFLERASEISPDNPDRHVKLGKLYVKQGDTEKADLAFQTAMKKASSNAKLITEIGEIYLAAGEDAKAATAFTNSINVSEDVHVYNRLGIALRRRKEFGEAVKVYQKALRIDQNDEVLYFNVGRVYVDMGQYGEAISAFKQALKLDPEFKECKDMLAQVLKHTGRS